MDKQKRTENAKTQWSKLSKAERSEIGKKAAATRAANKQKETDDLAEKIEQRINQLIDQRIKQLLKI